MAALVILAVLITACTGALWLPHLRVQQVSASGPNADQVEAAARGQLAGTYGFVVPRDSIFFLPKEAVRTAVLAQVPEVADVSISRSSLTALEIVSAPRAKAFVWCGVSVGQPSPDGACYEADAEGLIYTRIEGTVAQPQPTARTDDTAATDDPGSASTTIAETIVRPPPSAPSRGTGTDDLLVYSALDRELGEGESPVGRRVTRAAAMPGALRFVEAVETLNLPVISLVLRDDEADLWVNNLTRITYVIGREESAANLAASVIPKLELLDGTIQYLDLRFNGKAYLKRYGE